MTEHRSLNAVAESTIGTIKIEALGTMIPADIHEVRGTLFWYIEGYYNNLRMHSSIGCVSPMEREKQVLASAA